MVKLLLKGPTDITLKAKDKYGITALKEGDEVNESSNSGVIVNWMAISKGGADI